MDHELSEINIKYIKTNNNGYYGFCRVTHVVSGPTNIVVCRTKIEIGEGGALAPKAKHPHPAYAATLETTYNVTFSIFAFAVAL